MAESPLVGTWRLLEWYNATGDGARSHPLGRDAAGYISYTPQGHVFVQIMATGRASYSGSDPFGGNPAEDGAAVKSQISYAGLYSFHGDHVVHHVTLASFPNWIGTDQVRKVAWQDDRLTLSAEGVVFQGQEVPAFLDWARTSGG